MIALRLAIRFTPTARVTVITAGSPSGIADTADARAIPSMLAMPNPRSTPTPNVSALQMIARMPSILPSAASCSCRGPWVFSVSCSNVAILPTSVCAPVPYTTARARPRVTAVAAYTRLVRSPTPAFSVTVSSCLATVVDSPVSIDSSTSRLLAKTSRASAGTLSPASSASKSPGTRLAVSTSVSTASSAWPGRRNTVAFGAARDLSCSMACSALYSWEKPMRVLTNTTTPITIASA